MKQFLALFVSLVLLASACSESADPVETGQGANDDAAAADDSQDTEEAPQVETEDPPTPEPDDEPDSSEPDTEEPAAEEPAEDPAPEESEPAASTGDSVVAGLAGEPWFLGEIPATAVAADTTLEPIKIGMINQENTPLGSFPEVRSAAETAVAFINAELGGVDGRPIELSTCITSFNPEESAGCAQELVQEGVVALVGGVDVTSNGSFPIIEQNELPMVGGIPAGLVRAT